MNQPASPVAAATHPDPYPYYASLAATRPLFFDPALALWVAGSSHAVNAVLTHPACRVRPLAEPVPGALLGTAAASIFRRLVRMNDGAAHCPFKRAIAATLDSIDEAGIVALARQWRLPLAADPDFAFRLPAYVVASWLGAAPADLPAIANWTQAFVRGIAPGADVSMVRDADAAAAALLAHFGTLLAGSAPNGLHTLAQQAKQAGCDDPAVVVANAAGFLSQGFDATAGLIGNAQRALQADPARHQLLRLHPHLIAPFIDEVLMQDPPIQNTRRFAVEDCVIAGQQIHAGDTILVLLAAASRNTPAGAANGFAFGRGAHACPGAAVATAIARVALEHLLHTGDWLRHAPAYQPSVNARIPTFHGVAQP